MGASERGDVIAGVREAAVHHVLFSHALVRLGEYDVDREGCSCCVRDTSSEEQGVELDLVSSLSVVVDPEHNAVAWPHLLCRHIPGCGFLERAEGDLPSFKWWGGNLHQKVVGELI